MRSATVRFAVLGASLAALGPGCKAQSADTDNDEVIDELRDELRDVRDELRDVRAELRDMRPRLADLEKLGTVEPAEAPGPATAVATPTSGKGAGSAAPPAAPVQAGPIRVTISSKPKGARVFLDKRYLGKTPLLYQHPGVAKGLELRIERGGYNPHLRSLDLERDVKLNVTLTRIKRTPPKPTNKTDPPSLE